MAEIPLMANRAQLPKLLLQAPKEVCVEGRGTGKSFDIGFTMDKLIRMMPRAVIALTGKTYGQLLTRTLPSSLKLLGLMGYQKDVHYVIGRKPPSGFVDSYETLNKFDNVISFCNGTRFAMISQSEPGSGRGANTDYEIVDEALLLDREQYNNEVTPTNRGNREFFGKLPFHHGFKYSTSMPVNKEGRWVLEYADYYYRERGLRIFEMWNRVVMAQVELLPLVDEWKQTGNRELVSEFRRQWNEMVRLKKQITPFVSRDGVLFTLSNAFDNLTMLGFDYILKNQKQLPLLVFMTEIMNLYYDKVEDCFYSLQEKKHVYYNTLDAERLGGSAAVVEAGLAARGTGGSAASPLYSCAMDRDCDSTAPLELSFDWGSSICVMCVWQPRHWDFVQGCASEQVCQTLINEFFVKPDGSDRLLIEELLGKFCQYYERHSCRELVFFKDKYGDHKNPNVLNSMTFNEMALDYLRRFGWTVQVVEHRGMEPPQSDKYLLWGVILGEQDANFPRFRVNGDKCKYALISMNNARVKQVAGKLEKDKSSERKNSGVLPEEATHFSDAVDKLVWTKFSSLLRRSSSESYVRVGGRSVM